MPYNELLAIRIQKVLAKAPGITSKKMFGGIAFMVDGKMAVGVIKDDLMLRLDPAEAARALNQPHTRPMDFSGRPMAGYIYVAPGGTASDAALRKWVEGSVAFTKTLPAKKPRTKARKG